MNPSRFRVRGFFRGVVYAIANPLARRGVPPESITYFTLLLSLIATISLVLSSNQPLFGLFVFLTGLFDGVDGAVAKMREVSSPSGALTDSVIDRVADLILLFGITLSFQNEVVFGMHIPIWTMFCVAGWFLTSYTRARADSLGVQDLDVGLGARSERLLTLVLFSAFSLTQWGLVVVTLMGLLTAAYRFWHYKKELQSKIE